MNIAGAMLTPYEGDRRLTGIAGLRHASETGASDTLLLRSTLQEELRTAVRRTGDQAPTCQGVFALSPLPQPRIGFRPELSGPK